MLINQMDPFSIMYIDCQADLKLRLETLQYYCPIPQKNIFMLSDLILSSGMTSKTEYLLQLFFRMWGSESLVAVSKGRMEGVSFLGVPLVIWF